MLKMQRLYVAHARLKSTSEWPPLAISVIIESFHEQQNQENVQKYLRE